jgi:hypothetical protein
VHVKQAVESLMAEGIYPPADPTAKALELLTVAHGVASMLISRPYLPWGDAEAFADRVLRSVCVGHVVAAAIPADTPVAEVIATVKAMVDGQYGR